MAQTKLAVDSQSRDFFPTHKEEAARIQAETSTRAFEKVHPHQIDSRWEDHILDYYRAIRLVLADGECPLVATLCHTILLHERKLVPTASIQKVLDRNALPYQLVNRLGKELNEQDIMEWWYRNGRSV